MESIINITLFLWPWWKASLWVVKKDICVFLYHNWDGEADLSEGSFLAVASQKPVVTEIHMKINY